LTWQHREIVSPDAGAHTFRTGLTAHVRCTLRRLGRRLLRYRFLREDRMIGDLIERARPPSLRAFDQIAMKTSDLIYQVRAIAPHLADRKVVFLGDDDLTSLVLGLLAVRGGPCPTEMLVLDFDLRLLASARAFAAEHDFGHLLAVRPYNVFDSLPEELRGHYEWFYTNPPYGSCNEGLSTRIFLGRAMELTDERFGYGCAILPCASKRPWADVAWSQTKQFFYDHGWEILENIDGAHRYHLDDDPDLTSSAILVRRSRPDLIGQIPFEGRRIDMVEIRNFYGRESEPPFPRYILEDGSYDFDWNTPQRLIA
jgi:Branched-chain polyamine synthase A C-terminal domain